MFYRYILWLKKWHMYRLSKGVSTANYTPIQDYNNPDHHVPPPNEIIHWYISIVLGLTHYQKYFQQKMFYPLPQMVSHHTPYSLSRPPTTFSRVRVPLLRAATVFEEIPVKVMFFVRHFLPNSCAVFSQAFSRKIHLGDVPMVSRDPKCLGRAE